MNSMRLKFSILISLCSVILLISSANSTADVKVDEQQNILAELNAGKIPQFSPQKEHPKASKLIIRNILDLHYRKPLIDDGFSEMVYESFLERLDGNKSYLSAKDMKDYNIEEIIE